MNKRVPKPLLHIWMDMYITQRNPESVKVAEQKFIEHFGSVKKAIKYYEDNILNLPEK